MTPRQTHPVFPDDRLPRLHRLVLRWYQRRKRFLPWRDVDDPYRVLVSEIMLQQTQVRRVVEAFPKWMRRFPTITRLANAPRREVLLSWTGMGYNRRALDLQQIAVEVHTRHRGRIPSSPEALMDLPGIGMYTAHAVACFAFRRRVPVVDTNVHRVLSRLITRRNFPAERLPQRDIWEIARQMLPPRAFYNWNQALMDLGATVCTAVAPRCADCPVARECASAGNIIPIRRERSPSRKPVPRRIFRGRIVEMLRQAQGHSLPLRIVGKRLEPDFSDKGVSWLLDVLHGLERDGFIHATTGKQQVSINSSNNAMEHLHIHLAE